MLHREGVHRAEGVPHHTMPLQPLYAPHHLLEGALAATVTTIGIVQMLRAVDADTHEPTVVAEEATPLVGE